MGCGRSRSVDLVETMHSLQWAPARACGRCMCPRWRLSGKSKPQHLLNRFLQCLPVASLLLAPTGPCTPSLDPPTRLSAPSDPPNVPPPSPPPALYACALLDPHLLRLPASADPVSLPSHYLEKNPLSLMLIAPLCPLRRRTLKVGAPYVPSKDAHFPLYSSLPTQMVALEHTDCLQRTQSSSTSKPPSSYRPRMSAISNLPLSLVVFSTCQNAIYSLLGTALAAPTLGLLQSTPPVVRSLFLLRGIRIKYPQKH